MGVTSDMPVVPGDERVVADALFGTLYAELHRLARRELQPARSGGGLGVTTLLHEAYLSISGQGRHRLRRSRPLHGLRRPRHARPDHRRRAAAAVREARRAVRDHLARHRPRRPRHRPQLADSDQRCPRRARRGRTGSGRDRRPEVLLRLLVRRDRRDARRLGADHSAQLGEGPPLPAPRDRQRHAGGPGVAHAAHHP